MKLVVILTLALWCLSLGAASAKPACNCRDHLEIVKRTLANAVTLRDRYKKIADKLDAEYAQHHDLQKSQARFWALQKVVGAGITAPDPTIAIESVAYIPAGDTVFPTSPTDRAGEMKRRGLTNSALCAPSDPKFASAIEESASCSGLVALTRKHELSHQQSCETHGFFNLYFDAPGGDLAREEIKAYEIEITGLRTMLANAAKRCKIEDGYIAKDELALTIVIPELRLCRIGGAGQNALGPISATVKIQRAPTLFRLSFEPTGKSEGRYSFDSGFLRDDSTYVRHWGNGRYGLIVYPGNPAGGFPSVAFLKFNVGAECSYWITKPVFGRPKPKDGLGFGHNVYTPEEPDETCFGPTRIVEPRAPMAVEEKVTVNGRVRMISLQAAKGVCGSLDVIE